MHSEKVVAALLSAGLLVASVHARAMPLTNIDGIGTETGFMLNSTYERYVISMEHDAAAGRSTYVQRGAWDYTTWEGPPLFLEFEGIFAWTARIAPDGLVTDPGSMLFIGDLGSGDEILISGQLRMVGVEDQGLGETAGTYAFSGLQYLFTLDVLDARLSALGNAFRFDLPIDIESVYESPFYEDFEIDGDSLWSDPGLIGVNVPEPGSLALLGLGLAGLGLSRRRRAA